MNIQIETLISAFAKSHKQSKAKLMLLVEECLNTILQPVQPKSCAGRKASDSIVQLRQAIRDMSSNIKGQTFTVKHLATTLNASHIDVSNTINYLATNEKLFVRQGKKAAYGKGRPEILWGVL